MAKYDMEAIHEYIYVILKNSKLSSDEKIEMLSEVVENLRKNKSGELNS